MDNEPRVVEQGGPQIDGVAMSLGDARGSSARVVRLEAREVEQRRTFNEARLERLQRDFVRLGLDPVVLGNDAADAVHATLLDWANARVGAGRGTQ